MSRNNKGFSLIEISIVLIIISILVAGIIYGASMIKNAKVTGFLVEVREYRTATAAFITKYDEIPGDSIKIVNSNLPDLTLLDAGNNNGIIGDSTNDKGYLDKESYEFFKHLGAAGLIPFQSNVPSSGNDLGSLNEITIGKTYPGTKLGTGYFFYIDSYDVYNLFESRNKLSVFNKTEGTKGIRGDLMKILQSKVEGNTIFSEFSNE